MRKVSFGVWGNKRSGKVQPCVTPKSKQKPSRIIKIETAVFRYNGRKITRKYRKHILAVFE